MSVEEATATRATAAQEPRAFFTKDRHHVSLESATHLSNVLDEIVELMNAHGILLTLHVGEERSVVLLYAGGRVSDQARDVILRHLADLAPDALQDDRCLWQDSLVRHAAILLMPVQQTGGHSRLVISVLFDRPDRDMRSRAERLYRERRPFAVGFFQLWQQNRILQQRVQSYESVLNQTAIGVVMINRTGHIVFANQMAVEILATGDGISRSSDTLHAASFADGVNLQVAMNHAIANAEDRTCQRPLKAPLIALHRKKRPPLVAAFLSAAIAPVEPRDVAATMYLVDPRIDTEKMLAPLCRLYGLSPVETALVCHLAAGATIAATAQQMRVKEPTARSYLKTIFIKTGTRRQTELIVLMLSSLVRTKHDILQEALTFMGSDRLSGGYR